MRAAGPPSTIGWSTCRNSSKRVRRSDASTALARAPSRRGPRTAGPEAQVEAAVAHVIEREGVPGERDGMAEVRCGDERAQPDALGDGGRGGEHGHRRMPGPVGHAAPPDVVVGPRRVKPGAVGPLPLPAGLGPAVGGQDDEADAHGVQPTWEDYLVAVANEKESKRWNDDQWVEAWPKRERLTEALTPYLLAAADRRAHSGQRVCDIGCGGGALDDRLGRGGGVDGAGGRDRHLGAAGRAGPERASRGRRGQRGVRRQRRADRGSRAPSPSTWPSASSG